MGVTIRTTFRKASLRKQYLIRDLNDARKRDIQSRVSAGGGPNYKRPEAGASLVYLQPQP